MNKSLTILCVVATLFAASLPAQNSDSFRLLHTEEWRRSLLNKPYTETMDSLESCLKRMEAANISLDDEAAEWNKIRTFAVARHDERLALSVDFYLAYNHVKRLTPVETLIALYQQIIDRAEQISFHELMIRSLDSQSNHYIWIGDYETGFAAYKQLEKQLESIADEVYPDKIRAYDAMSSIYFKFREYETTIRLLKKAVGIPVTLRNLHGLLSVRNTMGACYMKLNKLDSAEFYFQSIVSETRFSGNYLLDIYKAIARKSLADMDVLRGEYEKAIPVYQEVFDFMSGVSSEYDYTTGVAIALAVAYLHTGKIREAEALFSNRLKREHITAEKLREWYEVIYLYHQQTGELGKALAYADSTRRKEKEEYDTFNAMRLLLVEQQVNALDIKLSDAEKEKTRNYLLFALAGCLLLSIALGAGSYLHRKIARKNRSLYITIQEMRQKDKEAERQLLGAHKKEVGHTMQLFRQLSELMRNEKIFTRPDLNRKKLADRLNTNESYLADSIREATGKTFSNYISELRLQYTLELLNERPDMTLDVIATDSGHGSYSSYLRLFTKKYGITPSEYRKIAASKVSR